MLDEACCSKQPRRDAQNMDLKTRVRGPGRTTKEDWINIALHTLITEGVEQVKILTLANKLNCARSSLLVLQKPLRPIARIA